MGHTLTNSGRHYRKAVTRLPLGVASKFRYWGEDRTIYVAEGRGARLRGNDYSDNRLGYGPAILGYADQRVDDEACLAETLDKLDRAGSRSVASA